MKYKLARWKMVAVAIPAFALLVYLIPVIGGLILARPLYGCFKMGECMGGHETFLLIEESQAFDYCPGHRQKDLAGSVHRTKDSVTIDIVNERGQFLIKREGRRHVIHFPESSPTPIAQVSNPWRLWLPSILPE